MRALAHAPPRCGHAGGILRLVRLRMADRGLADPWHGLAAQTGVVMIVYIDHAYERRLLAGKINSLEDIIEEIIGKFTTSLPSAAGAQWTARIRSSTDTAWNTGTKESVADCDAFAARCDPAGSDTTGCDDWDGSDCTDTTGCDCADCDAMG